MITGSVFKREMMRLTQPNGYAIGLHVPVWMAPSGRFDEDLFGKLFGEATRQLRSEVELVEFVDFLLQENAGGRVRYFPKLSELKTYLHQFLAKRGKPARKPVRSWHAPDPEPEKRLRYEEAAKWWKALSAEDRTRAKEEIIQGLEQKGNAFMATYLEQKDDQWAEPLESPLVMAEIFDRFQRSKVPA